MSSSSFHYLWGSSLLLGFFPLGRPGHRAPGVSWGGVEKAASVRNLVPFHGLTLARENLSPLCSPGRCVEGTQATGLRGKPLKGLHNWVSVRGQRCVGRMQEVIASPPLQRGRRGACLAGACSQEKQPAVFKCWLCLCDSSAAL